MPRAKDAKVWNEDLVLALRAREEQCRKCFSVKQYLWRDAARALEGVRQDIYQYKGSGRIVGLPSILSKTVEEECRAIIGGNKPLLPPDYIPTTVAEERKAATTATGSMTSTSSNPYHNDPYLKRIKMRGGSYAILMAFHFSQTKTMTKTQLCTAAQDYCDEEMEPNFGAGRSYGAWSSKKTLINHGLIKESRSTQIGRRGHRCNGVFEYTLTHNGEKFLKALLQKFTFTDSGTAVESERKYYIDSNEMTKGILGTNVVTAPRMGMNSFRTQSNHTHTSIPSKKNDIVDLLSDIGSVSDDENFLERGCERRNKPLPKRRTSKENVNPNLTECSERDFSLTIPVKDPQTSKTMTLWPTVDLDSSEDEDDDYGLSPIFQRVETISSQIPRPANTECHDQCFLSTRLIILIDNRERNRNATPRHMRMELTRHLSDESGLLRQVWPKMPLAMVNEEQLNYGDFAFLLEEPGCTKRLPVSIERKRLSDLVQRSCRADHWKQLSRMRDCCEHAILLVEGNTNKVSQFSPAEVFEQSWHPDHHSIDDENGFYRFLGRAILSSSKFRVIQTRDEQASYRAVGGVGLVAAQMEWKNSAPPTAPPSKKQQNQLYVKLKSRGIPWQISRRISEELISVEHLDQIFQQCQASARSTALIPIISHSCSSLIKTEKARRLVEYGTVEAWSGAIHSAWNSKHADPECVTSMFEEYKIFANDRAKLLAALHEGRSVEIAVHESNIMETNTSMSPSAYYRKVQIECSTTLARIFPPPKAATEECFYEMSVVEQNPLGMGLPSIVLQTVSYKFQSDRMVLSVLEGTDFISRLKRMTTDSPLTSSVDIAYSVAKRISLECNSFLLRKPKDRSVLIVQGLLPALDEAAKHVGYQARLKVLADITLTELMLRYGIVVVQAFRLANDLEMIVREFAMACFHYQLTTRKWRLMDAG
jgi:ERCC4-type nuclease